MAISKTPEELRGDAARIHATGDDSLVGSEVRDLAQSVLELGGRGRLPMERPSITKRFELRYVDQDPKRTKRVLKLYLVAGMYADTAIGEIFIKAEDRPAETVDDNKQEDRDSIPPLTVGALDSLAMAISVGLQHGVPLKTLTSKLKNNKFGPNGFTGDPDIRSYTSVFDLIAQWLDLRFPDGKLAVMKGPNEP